MSDRCQAKKLWPKIKACRNDAVLSVGPNPSTPLCQQHWERYCRETGERLRVIRRKVGMKR